MHLKKVYLIIALFCTVVIGSCKKEEITSGEVEKLESACGLKDPANSLPWLKAIISKAEEDRINKTHMGNYMGKIYLEKYKGQDLFYVTMMMGSGGLSGYVFRCDGSIEDFNKTSEERISFDNNMKKDKIIYTNVP